MSNNRVANYVANLEKTLSPNLVERKSAENFLLQASTSQTHIIDLLEISLHANYSHAVKLSASINLKNFIKKSWHVEKEHDDPIPEENRNRFKAMLIDAMLQSSGNVQNQIAECVSIIGKSDFPNKWPGLLPDLISRMSQYGGNVTMSIGVLQIADSLFKRYQHECSSQDLFKEMIMVITQFGSPLTELSKNLCSTLEKVPTMSDKDIKEMFTALNLILEIFYSLNCQDLPEFFEDNLKDWMTIHNTLLTISPEISKKVKNSCEKIGADKNLIENLKSQICCNIILYATRYEEEFSPFLSTFVTDVWGLLTDASNLSHDLLAGNLIEFISSVVAKPQHRKMFESPEALQKLCEAVILPNIQFKLSDEECFEDSPEDYISQDLENSDSLTRRRSACTLVYNLCEAFGSAVMDNFSGYIKHLLEEYEQGKINGGSDNKNWHQKDAALMLVTSVCAMGKTGKLGVTVTSNLVDIEQFFAAYILPELSGDKDVLPVIKADCLKYAIEFRSKLSPVSLKATFEFLPNLMKSRHYVVHSYACILLEKALQLTQPNDQTATLFSIADLPNIGLLFENMFVIMTLKGSEENLHAIKAIVKLMTFMQSDIVPFMGVVVNQLTQKLAQVAKNPSRPQFNHFLFECISFCVVVTCNQDPTAIQNFEMALSEIFQDILNRDVTEFFPYVFQLYSLFLEQYPACEVIQQNLPPDVRVEIRKTATEMKPQPGYLVLLNQLLVPSLWSQNALIPSLSRLLRAYLLHYTEEVIQSEKFESILGVYQRLVKSKSFDQYAFSILQAVVMALPKQRLTQYLKHLMVCLFERLQADKTSKFMQGFTNFIAQFCLLSNPNDIVQVIDSINPGLFGKLLNKVIVPHANLAIIQKQIPTTTSESNWYTTSIGLCRLLFQSAQMSPFQSGSYQSYFYPLLISLLEGMSVGPNRAGDEAISRTIDMLGKPDYKIVQIRLLILDAERSSASFHLALAVENNPEPFVEVYDPRVYLAKFLGESCNASPGILPGLVNPKDDQNVLLLQNFATKMNVNLK